MIAAWMLFVALALFVGTLATVAAIIQEWEKLTVARRIICIGAAVALFLLGAALTRRALDEIADNARHDIEVCLAAGGIPDRSGSHGEDVDCYPQGEG